MTPYCVNLIRYTPLHPRIYINVFYTSFPPYVPKRISYFGICPYKFICIKSILIFTCFADAKNSVIFITVKLFI